jgi:hypothetical protein
MNLLERKMLDLLRLEKESYGCIALKAEFEAEGTRVDELLRLIEIARKADVGIALKVGGCEAIRDLLESKQIGVDYIVAPMIETPYALTKFIDAINKIYSKTERDDTKFLFNVETKYAFSCLDDLIEIAVMPNGVDGIVFGRVDFSLSTGLSRNDINSDKITDIVLSVSQSCRNADLEFVVGGGVSMDSLPMLKKIKDIHLSRFETRKVIFSSDALKIKDVAKGLLNAVHFELLWLQNKQNYYTLIGQEDATRIKMLEERWKALMEKHS